jgi:hypothetical protein
MSMAPQPNRSSHEESHDTRHRELMRLVEIYALRTRELSEAVAVLGGHITAEREIHETIVEIKKIRVLLDRAGMDLLAFVEPFEN